MSRFLNIDDTNNIEYYVVMLEDIDENLETMRIEEEPPIDDEIQSIKTFAESKSATNFVGFETVHNTILDILDRLLCSDGQTKVGQMYDDL